MEFPDDELDRWELSLDLLDVGVLDYDELQVARHRAQDLAGPQVLRFRRPRTVPDQADSEDEYYHRAVPWDELPFPDLNDPAPVDDDDDDDENLNETPSLIQDVPDKVPVLNAITLRSMPLNHHAVAMSCDADLAVAADDSVHVLLPEFPTPDDPVDPDVVGNEDSRSSFKSEQYHQYRGQFMDTKQPNPRVNRDLFEAAGFDIDDVLRREGMDSVYFGVGNQLPTGYGSSLKQVAAIAWSPNEAGHNLRPILAVLLTNGSILAYGEKCDREFDLSTRTRSFRNWRILWGVGGVMPLPLYRTNKKYDLPRDKITAFAWAKYMNRGRCVLSYVTADNWFVVLAVQYLRPIGARLQQRPTWKVEEIWRGMLKSPHNDPNIYDMNFVPFGSNHNLQWSPWLVKGAYRHAIVAYVQRGYVGFRKVTMDVAFSKNEMAEIDTIDVEGVDLSGLCFNTLSGAFIEWEDVIRYTARGPVCRCAMASPFRTQLLEVPFERPKPYPSHESHTTDVCGTTYPKPPTQSTDINPITSLVLLPNSQDPSLSICNFARASASAEDLEWYQRIIQGEHLNNPIPQWVSQVDGLVNLSVPVTLAGRDNDSDSEGGGPPGSNPDEDGNDDLFDLPADAGEQVNPMRCRIWGFTASPGCGMTVALVSNHSTLGPERRPKCKIMFSWNAEPRKPPGYVAPPRPSASESRGTASEIGNIDPQLQQEATDEAVRRDDSSSDYPILPDLTTEGRMWEWMYGGGPPVRGSIGDPVVDLQQQPLYHALKEYSKTQTCSYCTEPLVDHGRYHMCSWEHSFATCAATGVAIWSPNISMACGVCGRRTLHIDIISKLLRDFSSLDLLEEWFIEKCGGCGGKFIS